MELLIRAYRDADAEALTAIWNGIVEEGAAFPQTEPLSLEEGRALFSRQTHTAVAADRESGAVLGFYLLHPNNVGRCGHIGNATYGVNRAYRGLRTGEALVRDSLAQAKAAGFRLLQFNAVVASNLRARRLYERLGFQLSGTVPGGFLLKDGRYEDICIYYHPLP